MFKHNFTNYQNPSDMYKKLCETEGEINEDQVYSIKKILDEIKKEIKNAPKNRKFKLSKEIKLRLVNEVKIKNTNTKPNA